MRHIHCKLLLALAILLFALPSFANTCTDEQVLGMIKLKVPFETVLKACGIEDQRDKEIGKETIKKTIKEDKEDLSVDNREKNGFRISLSPVVAEFSLTDNNLPSDLYDHTFYGVSFDFSFVNTNKNNLFIGGGLSISNASGPSTKQARGIFYNSTYGYYDVYIQVQSLQTTFLYGLIGYDVELGEYSSFQPNLRLGLRSSSFKGEQRIAWYSYADSYSSTQDSIESIGIEIDLPFKYSDDNSSGVGAGLCLCGTSITYTSGTTQFKVKTLGLFRIFADFYF
jgi:hypothetical protein